MKNSIYILFAAITMFTACKKDNNNDVPANTGSTVSIKADLREYDSTIVSDARGTLTGTIDSISGILNYKIDLQNIRASYSHIHEGMPDSANIIYNATVTTVTLITGRDTLTAADAGRLLNGDFYADVHSFEAIPGTISGQIVRAQ